MKTEQYKVMLADDHILLRDALASLINNQEFFQIIGVAADGTEVKSLIENGPVPDIIILDLNMPNMDGYETTCWLNKNYPEVKILILTMYDSDVALIRLLQEGVRGFLKKDIHPRDLIDALTTVAEDGYYYGPNTGNKLALLFKKDGSKHDKLNKVLLSAAEIEFLKLASTEKTYKEIAMQMHMSTRSIDAYRDELFDKLDVKSRVGLAIYAVKNGIVSF